ncbi:MAG: 4Fe-4S binding protein [Deltaproteobacteria bacterium]|nr:4Fe-4S binding protein [Deltaproteobacteria bacterium]MBW2138715.1 4Fe-4S binding protein [Deltaproteobacteria bacterium]
MTDSFTASSCDLKDLKHHNEKGGTSNDILGKGPDIDRELDEEGAVREAERCLGNHPCDSCDLCRWLCPDLCITRNEKTGLIEIDYDFCKGCGICAFICPKGAIEMELEEM